MILFNISLLEHNSISTNISSLSKILNGSLLIIEIISLIFCLLAFLYNLLILSLFILDKL